jgi:hypothetical protein
MANRHPDALKARMGKKRKRQPGNLHQLQVVLWNALLDAQGVLDQAERDNPELILKAVHAVSQCAGQYAKLLEIGELEARVQAIEAAMQGSAV